MRDNGDKSQYMSELNDELKKQIRKLAITKQLNFLIGSGASVPAIPLMSSFKDEQNGKTANEQLTEKVKEISTLITDSIGQDASIVNTQKDYSNFLQSILDVLNLSNSRQTPKNANIFTTNYDLFIEKAADTVLQNNRLVFNDGANGYFDRILNSANYNRIVAYKGLNDNYIAEIPSISLIKPHGSMNWEKANDAIKLTNNVVDCPVVVPPTGYESSDTFLSNHFYDMLRVFQTELDKPQSVLFVVGFSFQDTHIGKMIKRAMQNPELMIYAFAYQKTDKKTFLDSKHLSMQEERNNFKIIVPNDGEQYTLKDVTNILSGATEKDLTDDKN